MLMEQGTLYMTATPIGNLGDMTFRAVEVLKSCDIIYCEDTRQTGKLLKAYSIDVRMKALNEHAKDAAIQGAVKIILEGADAAFVSDSGTPGVSDPGGRLVSAAREAGIKTVPLPGPSALAAVISVCGYPAKRVLFAGFLSKKEGRRVKELESFRDSEALIVLYESPYRIRKLLASISKVYPEARLFIGREMTKRFEEFIEGNVIELLESEEFVKEKGEFTVVINPL